jgi:hypothetical protein
MKHSDDIVNLSPIRWLQDPLAEYKQNSDWKTFNDIRARINTVEPLDPTLIKQLFHADFTSIIGISYITKDGGWIREENSIISKVLQKHCDVLNNHIEFDRNDGWRVRVSELRPTPVDRPKTQVLVKNMMFETTHHTLSWVYFNGYTPDGKTYWTDNNLNGGHGLKEFEKDAVLPMSIHFKTREEAVNFENSTKTNFHRYIVLKMKTDQHFPFKFIPYLGNYKHPWTDDMLYKYFGLTDDEIKIIEDEMGKYK